MPTSAEGGRREPPPIIGRKDDFRLIPVGAGVWVGALCGLLADRAAVAAIVGVAGLIGGVATARVFTWRHRARHSLRNPHRRVERPALAVAASVAVVAGALVGGGAALRQSEDAVTVLAAQAVPVRLQVRINADPSPLRSPWGAQKYYVGAAVDKVRAGSQWIASNVEVVLLGAKVGDLSRGDRLVVYGKIDTDFWAQGRVVGSLSPGHIDMVQPAGGWQSRVNLLKKSMAAATLGLPPHARALVPGMSVGDDRLMEADLADSMRVTSLTHLTAVSGSHIAIVLALLSVLLPGGRWTRPLAVAVFLVVLVAVVGPEPSVLRAVWTGLVGLWGLVTRRGGQPQATLALIVIASLLIEPWMALSFGFALSVLATWGLLYSGRRWLRQWVSWWEGFELPAVGARLGKAVIEMTAISCAAQLWVMPILLLLNPWIPGWGVAANVLAGPAVAPITILGLAAAVVVGWLPTVAAFLCQLAVPFTWWVDWVATFCAAQPGAQLPWFPGAGGVVGAVLLIGLVMMFSSARGLSLLRVGIVAGRRIVQTRRRW